jgi:hypothetical protein
MRNFADLEKGDALKHGRLRQLAHGKKRFLFGSIIAALFLYSVARIWLLALIVGIIVAVTVIFGHGCQSTLDSLKELH